MPTTTPYADPAARTAELLRLHLLLDQVYPLDYYVNRKRWHAQPPGAEPEPLLGFLEWHALVGEWTERATFAELLGEMVEGLEVEGVVDEDA